MTSRKKASTGAPPSTTGSTPSQQDAGDILAEVGAVPSENGNGELEVDEAKIREVGAVDAESVLENRRGEEIVGKVRSGQKGVLFNLDNVLEKYDLIIRTWPPNTIDILVSRLTGTAVQWVIQTRPRSGADLYTCLLTHHGRSEEAEYQVLFIDSVGKQRRGSGRITMPDMRDTPPTPQSTPQGQPPPMNPYYPPPYGGQQLPPQQSPPTVQVVPATVDPIASMEKMFGIFQQMQSSARQSSPGAGSPPPVAPVAAPTADPLALMEQAFRMFQQMRQPQSEPVVPQPIPAPSLGQSTDPMAMMEQSFRLFQQMQTQPHGQPQPQPSAAAPPSNDPLATMEHAFRMFQQMQTQAQPPPVVVAPQAPSTDPLALLQQAFKMFREMQPQPAPQPAAQSQPAPPVNAPPGMVHVPGFGFIHATKLLQAIGGEPAAPGPGYTRPAYGGPRPYYPGPQGQGQDERHQPPPRPKTAFEEFEAAASVIDSAMAIAQRFGGGSQAAPEPEHRPSDDSPVTVVKYGDWPVVINKKDGSPRWGETGVANTGNILKWIAEQREAVMKAQAEREARQQRQQRPLPAGYVEVTPGFKPPPGYVAIPAELPPEEALLPQPPQHMPPPLVQDEPMRARAQDEPPKRTWGAPPMPGSPE